MTHDSEPHGRRNVLKMTGAALASTAIAGCSGSDGGNGGAQTTTGDDGGAQTTTGDGSDESGDGGDSTAPSYEATVPEANLELGTMPHLAAVRDIMPSNTDGRMTGSVRRFENVRLMITALNSGAADTYTNAPANLFFSQAAGNDYKIIAPKMYGTDYYIVGHSEQAPSLESFVNNPDELTFAINQKGNIDHLQVVGVYDQEGLDFSQASTVNVGGSSARIDSFLSGRTQGFTCHIEQFERLQNEDEPVELLAKVSEYYPDFVQECVAVPTESLQDSTFEAWIQEYVNAIFQANKRANEDFQWVFETTEKYQAQPLDEDTARSTWELFTEDMGAWQYEEFEQSPFESVYEMLRDSGQLEREIDVGSMFEPKYAEQAMSQL